MFGSLICLILGVSLVLVLILVLRFHAFLALILSALVVAFASDQIPALDAIGLVTREFGGMMGGIGILLALAAIIGKCMMDSGAADRIVRAFSRLFGRDREEYSLLSSGFVLSVPVFFDIVFYLLAPLARAAYAQRKRDYVLLVTVIGTSAAITHAMVPPTPGPILVAEAFGVSILMTMGIGLLCSIVPLLIGGLLYPMLINRWMPITPRDTLGVQQEELNAMSARPDDQLPGLFVSLLPFMLPVLMLTASAIAAQTLLPWMEQAITREPSLETQTFFFWLMDRLAVNETTLLWLTSINTIIGDKNIVFFLGALFAIGLVLSQKNWRIQESVSGLESAISSAAIIAFITCAGGAFGKTLAAAGIGNTIADAAQTWNIPLLLLAFGTAALIRVAQGSATVAMITTAGIIAPVLGEVTLAYHPAYLIATIGLAATGFSWMNDSGFWLFGKLTGLTETQTLRTWTASLSIMAIAGLIWVMLLSTFLPFA